jgi:hypothetical protein
MDCWIVNERYRSTNQLLHALCKKTPTSCMSFCSRDLVLTLFSTRNIKPFIGVTHSSRRATSTRNIQQSFSQNISSKKIQQYSYKVPFKIFMQVSHSISYNFFHRIFKLLYMCQPRVIHNSHNISEDYHIHYVSFKIDTLTSYTYMIHKNMKIIQDSYKLQTLSDL